MSYKPLNAAATKKYFSSESYTIDITQLQKKSISQVSIPLIQLASMNVDPINNLEASFFYTNLP